MTGDNPLTACHIAKELKITTRKVLVLTPSQITESQATGSPEWVWQTASGSRTVTMDTKPAELGSNYDLCLAGEVSLYNYCYIIGSQPFFVFRG